MSLSNLKLKCLKAIEEGSFLNPREVLNLLNQLEEIEAVANLSRFKASWNVCPEFERCEKRSIFESVETSGPHSVTRKQSKCFVDYEGCEEFKKRKGTL